jgi:shikimate 5-dehydrogenase
VEEADLIVNATSLGLKPTDPSPVPPSLLSAHHLVYDLQTHDDAFQMEARFQGARVSNGLSMLVHQGALSFERWFGIKPDISAMRRALEQKHD